MKPTPTVLTQQLQLADVLLVGREQMLEPQDLPGRYGRVVKALDHVLQACQCEAVVGDGWAVWRHGYVGRVTQDIDIVLPVDRIDDFLRTASVSGFVVLDQSEDRWPKLTHSETKIDVDILPEGGRPGTPSTLAPTTIPHPRTMGANPGRLTYASLASLVEMKLAAGRLRDQADVVELLRENLDQVQNLQSHLEGVHPDYKALLDELRKQVD